MHVLQADTDYLCFELSFLWIFFKVKILGAQTVSFLEKKQVSLLSIMKYSISLKLRGSSSVRQLTVYAGIHLGLSSVPLWNLGVRKTDTNILLAML